MREKSIPTRLCLKKNLSETRGSLLNLSQERRPSLHFMREFISSCPWASVIAIDLTILNLSSPVSYKWK